MRYGKPKSVYEVLKSAADADLRMAKNKSVKTKREVHVLKAKCKRLAKRTIVVNNTVFSFDKNGITSVENVGNTLNDYRVLLRMNGVSEYVEETKKLEVTPKVKNSETSTKPVPEDTKPVEKVEEKKIKDSPSTSPLKKPVEKKIVKKRGRPKNKKE